MLRDKLHVTELKTSKMAARGRVEPPEKHFINWTVGVRWLVSTDRDLTVVPLGHFQFMYRD